MTATSKIPFPTPLNPKFKFIDLFAGIGGFRMALQNIGGECVFSSELDVNAQLTYTLNYGETPYGDITSDEIKNKIPENFDVLCAGFPCQPFSICGKKRGFEDTRGTLFFDVCQILEIHKPQVCFLENVQHLTKHDNGNTFRVIVDSLEDLGYRVSYRVLNAKDFGLPQHRERIFIVGTRKGRFNFNKIKFDKPVILEEFLDRNGDFQFLNKEEYTLLDSNLIHIQPKSGLIFVGYRNKGTWKNGIRPGTLHLSRCHRQPNRIYSIKGTHPTIPSQETSGRFFIYIPETNAVRKLTINECYRIMGFPSEFKKNPNPGHQYKQIGNSVAINVVQAIAQAIINQNLLSPDKITDVKYESQRNIRERQLAFDF